MHTDQVLKVGDFPEPKSSSSDILVRVRATSPRVSPVASSAPERHTPASSAKNERDALLPEMFSPSFFEASQIPELERNKEEEASDLPITILKRKLLRKVRIR